MTKKEMRKKMLSLRDSLSEKERREKSREIAKRLFTLEEFQKAEVVLSYQSFRSEVETTEMNQKIRESGKSLYLPKTYADRKEMAFYRVYSDADLIPGYQGILEPQEKEPFTEKLVSLKPEKVLMLMPGAAFDDKGNRIGYGGGYYDRFLSQMGGYIGNRFMLADEKMLKELGVRAKKASRELNRLGVKRKNEGLEAVAKALILHQDKILAANEKDVKKAKENQMKESLVDRLSLTEERIEAMAEGLTQIVALEDPVGEVSEMKTSPLGMQIGQKRVPLGVIGIIYESRPNVTADAFGLCFKTGNAVILRGGSDALNSNLAITKVIAEALSACDLPADSIQLLTDTSHETAEKFMRLNEYIDVLIPRGGAGLIKTVVEKSTVPVIETGTGNCHVYVDESADIDMAVNIIENAKTQRYGVCNACESLVIHKKIAKDVLPKIADRLAEHGVEMRGDEYSMQCDRRIIKASEEDYGTEYLDAIISIKTVDSLEEAIEHINHYNTGHSEAIVTSDYHNAMTFLNDVDAAAVYVNASTRFTDGFEFGFGAEIGISTQKLHARGPMGLKALTTTKYIILGDGQIRQ